MAAMNDEILSLKWNNHRTTFLHVLSNVRLKESYSDATITCEGKFYPIHKLVVSSCSDYFDKIFQATQCKHPVIVMKDIRHDDMEALLNYMYLGEVKVLQRDLPGLLRAAECLKIKGLAVPDEAPKTEKCEMPATEGDPGPPRKRSKLDECIDTSSLPELAINEPEHTDYSNQENGESIDIPVQPFADTLNIVKEEVKFENEFNEDNTLNKGLIVAEDQIYGPAGIVSAHSQVTQEPLRPWGQLETSLQNSPSFPVSLANSVPDLNMTGDPGNTRINTLKCPFCEKLFIYPAKLASHVRTHTGEKPYACPYCPYRATQQGNLNRHVKIRHHVDEGN
ncbi:transcription activator GAGA isoform X2 [Procambarus clarkii]|nr:zinc finger and BTB domain-containing protein 14-like [Procambarus clarkii]XP_045583255.1 zinc finger and BTB domain-containing protein 14-like [Procambarus clarkii]XP_045583257.1 zinc finger and BTB domain-containing protein 14-like [Procambarus clarkii]